MKKQFLVPKYVKEFQCIGNACEDNCCYGWGIYVDKNTYTKYKNISDPELKPLIQQYIKRNRKGNNDEAYAKIIMAEKQRCPFLDGEGLCKICIKKGSELLSSVCTIYPRSINKVKDSHEMSLNLSCPEVVRKALLNKDLMEFDEELINNEKIEKCITINRDLKKGISKYFWDIRIFVISLLQNRNFDVDSRLMILGIFIEELHNVIKQSNFEDVPNIIYKYKELLKSNELKDYIKSMPSNNMEQLFLASKLCNIKIEHGLTNINVAFIECLDEFVKGIENKTIDRQIYDDFMKDREYILENYVVDYVFSSLFPIFYEKDVFKDYIELVVKFSILKTLFLGSALFNDRLDDDMIIKIVYSFSRVVSHNPIFINKIVEYLKENNKDNLIYLFSIIKS